MHILNGIKRVLAVVGLSADQTVQKVAGIRVHGGVVRCVVATVAILCK